MRVQVGWWHGAALACLLTVGPALPSTRGGEADDPRLADYFGFLPLEVYKLEPRLSLLQTRDLDGDGVDDIIVANNARSRIDLLLSRKDDAATAATPPLLRSEVNQVASDRRMRLVSVPVNKQIVGLATGDFNGDARPDLAFHGTPAGLVVLPNDGLGRFDAAKARRVDVGEAVEASTTLTAADLNRDGRDDLAVLAAGEVVLVFQGENGRLAEPERVPHTAGQPRMLRVADLDGDGGRDLLVLDGGTDDPLRVRFSTEEGRLGPEQRFALEAPRAIALADVDGRPGAELLLIEGLSGRARVLKLAPDNAAAAARHGRLTFYPLPPGDPRGRSLDLGDLDGDGKLDVVVSDPASAQFLVFRQAATGGLGASRSFPGLVGGRAVRIADLDGDRKAEVLVLSEPEKQIGLSRLEEGRLTFPSPLPTTGLPVGLEVADLDGDRRPEVLYLARARQEGDEYALRALKRDAAGVLVPFRWGQDDSVDLTGLGAGPSGVRVIDVNRDGEPDILLFNAFGPPALLLGRKGAPPAPAGSGPGPLAGATATSLSVMDLDGPALIASQNTFARHLALDRDGRWQVRDQYNTGRGSAQVVGAAALDTDGDGVKEIVALDRASKSLLYLAREEAVYRPAGSLSIGSLDYQGMRVADLDGDGRDDLLIAGTDRFGIVLTGRKGQVLETLASHEPTRPEGRFSDLVVADLNADGYSDIALADTAEQVLEIVTYAKGPGLVRGLGFRIFERKSFRGGPASQEPRDLAVGDVDGDRRTDLVLIVHDRVLVYRQDPGPAKPANPSPGR